MTKIWQNANGTWSHYLNKRCQWAERSACEIDMRFSEEWGE